MTQKSIIITGGSDGIGKALAFEMAKRGYAIGLTARRLNLLEEVKAELEQSYPDIPVAVRALDVQEYDAIEPALLELKETLGTVDIVMANAGIARAGKVGVEHDHFHIDTINTNVNGAIKTVCAAMRIFREQGYGQIVGVSSVASYRGMPRNAAYCASKAALTTFLEGVRAETYRENIDVTVLHPGYIDTALNRNVSNRPFLIDVEKGAEIFADLIIKKVKRADVPRLPWTFVSRLLAALPTSVVARL